MDQARAKSILRSIGAVVLSLVVAFVLLIAVELLSSILHPWPENFSGTREEVERQVATYPSWILAFLGGAGWGGIMFLITWLATRLGAGRHRGHGLCIGAVFLGLVIMNMSMLPYPFWFWIFMLIVQPTAAYLGTTLGATTSIANSPQ